MTQFSTPSGGSAGNIMGVGSNAFGTDQFALLARRFGPIFRAHYPYQVYFQDSWLHSSTDLFGANNKTNERQGTSKVKLFREGMNLAVEDMGGGTILESLKRGRYIVRLDDEPSVMATGWHEYRMKETPDGGASFIANTARQYATSLAKSDALNAISTIIQTAAIPDPGYGGSVKTKAEAGSLAFTGYADNGADMDAGIVVNADFDDADPQVSGWAVEQALARAKACATHLGWQGSMRVLMATRCMRNWVIAQGKRGSHTAAIVSAPPQALSFGAAGSYAALQILRFAGFEIYECPWLDALGTEFISHFNATDFGGAAGSKYMPGSSYNASSTINKAAVHYIATEAGTASVLPTSGSEPTGWVDGGGAAASGTTANLFNKIRMIVFNNDAIERVVNMPTDAMTVPLPSAVTGVQMIAAKRNGFGPVRSESAFYFASAKAS